MKKIIALIIALFGSTGILIDTIMYATEDGINILKGIEIFKYFTIQSNLFVVIICIIFALELFKDKKTESIFIGGTLLYILITLIVFFIFLRPIWHPTGIRYVANLLLHYIVPIGYFGFVVYYRHDYSFEVGDIKYWIIYPILYTVMVLIVGPLTGDYIYPFFNIPEVGVMGFVFMFVSILVLFLILSILIVKIVSKSTFTNSD